jgi:transglutaminase-like putative cysteine protease
MRKIYFLILSLIFCSVLFGQIKNKQIESLISKGEFSKAETAIKMEIAKNKLLSQTGKMELQFEMERMDRIRLDFSKTEKDVMEYIKKYIPNVSKKDLKKWEAEKSLEVMVIDGKKMYFDAAARNLFRINKECKEIKAKQDTAQTADSFNLNQHLKEIISESESLKKEAVKPVRYRIDYTVTLKDGIVPSGEEVRCWLPFPREIKDRQENIKILSVYPEKYILSDNDKYMPRSLYLEDIASADKKLKFSVSYEYTCYAHYNKIDPEKVKAYNTDSPEYKEYTSERKPHIVFTDELKKISSEIVGGEKNPYLQAKKIFAWINGYAPWASAREYSTIRNIPMYCFENKHGDCGIQTLLFMTLARLNGIPTRWQSGWEPTSMHDWCQMYIEPYGWVPVDQSFGLQKSDDENIKWFYLGNIDSRRLVVNDDYAAPFYPAKIHPRSETVDFQRGELEWRGGNLYFNDWNYDFKITEIK